MEKKMDQTYRLGRLGNWASPIPASSLLAGRADPVWHISESSNLPAAFMTQTRDFVRRSSYARSFKESHSLNISGKFSVAKALRTFVRLQTALRQH